MCHYAAMLSHSELKCFRIFHYLHYFCNPGWYMAVHIFLHSEGNIQAVEVMASSVLLLTCFPWTSLGPDSI